MIDPVEITLKHWRTVPFRWGKEDCLLSIADYALLCTGHDFVAAWRGTYDTREGAYAHIEKAGGVINLVETACLPPVADPARGDIVVASVNGYEVGGLCTGSGIAMRLERGAVEVNKRFITILRSWHIS